MPANKQRPRTPTDVASLARSHTAKAIEVLARIMVHGKNESSQIAAARILIERGFGQPLSTSTSKQEITVKREDANNLAPDFSELIKRVKSEGTKQITH